MIDAELVVRAGRGARDCLAYVVDLRNLPDWDPSARSVAKLTEGSLGAGARFELRLRAGLRETAMHYEVLRYAPPYAATLRGEAEGVTVVDEIRVEPEDNGALLRWRANIQLGEGLGEQLARPWLMRRMRAAARRLETALRAPPPARLGATGRIADRLLLPGAARFTRQGFRAAGLPPITERGEGLHIAITGATSGLGEAAALMLARRGARISIVGRDGERLRALSRRLRVDSGTRPRIIETDLLDLDATRAAADALAEHDTPDVLINNAGALFDRRAETAQGFERALVVNLLSPLLLMQRVGPAMAAGGRIINVVSGGMYLTPLVADDLQYRRGRYDGAVAYGRAKRALAVLAARRAAQWPQLAVHAVHPGWADTPGVRDALPAFRRVMRPFLRNAFEGADSTVWLALADAGARSRRGVWFDRKPHALDVLPRTRLDREAIAALDGQIATLVGPWLCAGGAQA